VKEEEEVAKAVNRTLAEEKRKEDEEKKKQQNQEKKQEDGNKTKKEGDQGETKMKKNQDEACVTLNITCPVVDSCPEEKICPDCPPEKECPEVERCGPCPPIHCQPCPVANCTSVDDTARIPQECPIPVEVTMPLPVAIAVGATLGALVTGVAAGIGLLLRYASPIESGILFVATIIVVWYLCSHHPEAAREIGGRAVAILREATLALSTRVMAALQRQQEQVGALTESNLFFKMSSMFQKGLH
jgi:hypothetical protein